MSLTPPPRATVGMGLAAKQLKAARYTFIVIASLLLLTACGGAQEEPTPTSTLQPPTIAMTTMTPVPTATAVPTNTPEPPTDTPAATATNTAIPPEPPTATPVIPTATSTITPTATAVPLMQVGEAKVIYHDADVVEGMGRYKSGIEPWIDLLVRLGDNWYGPERQEDDINALPLPDGYRWETEGSFSSLPTGEVWWTGSGVEGNARLIGPDGNELYTLHLKVEFY
jgi:hypothetical protein